MTARGIRAVREHLAKLPPSSSLTLAERRAQYDRAERVFPTPVEVSVEVVKTPERPAEWLTPPGVKADAVVLYLHGGGYAIGSPRSHRHLAAAIARAAGTRALLLDYRLAPEHPFPAALDDAVAAYQWLLGRGVAPGRIVLGGDSAGGGLTVAALIALRDRGFPRPGGGICISPWVDLTCSGASYATKAAADPIVTRDGVEAMAQMYVGAGDRKAALVSPLYADLRPATPAARPGGQRRSAARRRARARRPGARGGCRRQGRGVALDDPRLALVHADAGRGRPGHPRHRRLRARAYRLSAGLAPARTIECPRCAPAALANRLPILPR